MLPWVYEWHWDLGHYLFMGAFYLVALVIFVTLAVAKIRALLNASNAQAIDWKESFHDLPSSRTACRFAIDGVLPDKSCVQELDCRKCEYFQKQKADNKLVDHEETKGAKRLGLDINSDLHYHRGHTWVREEKDGLLAIGLDDFASRCLGNLDEVILPPVGTTLIVNGHGFDIRQGKREFRILSPVEGKVVELGTANTDWWLKVQAPLSSKKLDHLFKGGQAIRWSESEMTILMDHLGTGKPPFVGKKRILSAAYPRADWDHIYHDLFLNT